MRRIALDSLRPSGQRQLAGAVVDVRPQRALEPDGLGQAGVDDALRRIDRAVEHHAAYPLREQRRVRGADGRPVRKSEPVELLLPEQ